MKESMPMDRRLSVFFLFVFSLFVFLSATLAEATATPAHIIISEVQISGKDTGDDFIELYNPGSLAIDLDGYRLRYKNSKGTDGSLNEIDKKKANTTCIAPQGYFVWAKSDGDFAGIANTKTGTGLSENYSLAILPPKKIGDTILDSVSWGDKSSPFDETAFHFISSPRANQSIVRDISSGNWLPDFSPAPTPTPSTLFSCSPPAPPDPIPLPDPTASTPAAIRVNEIFPNPEAKGDSGEFIELYNFGSAAADISGWTLRDATKTGAYVFPSGTSLSASGYFVVTDQSFKISLNNTDETVSLFDKTGTLIDTVSYAKTKEDVSLNYTESGWRGGTPTPGSANILNNLPEIREKVPKKSYKNVATTFDATGKDSDGDTIKYVWDFGDGHKSYKNKTTHSYEKNGTYTVTLTTNDGKDDVTETFTLKISSYDPPKVRITALVPNPAGNDTDNEWLLIENREKKTVNLKGFSIATGWKTLTNHPIREDFFIQPKQEARLTRAFSLFTLPNQKSKIELRAPDGKVLQKIKYQLEKSITEESIYQKEKGKRWTWQTEHITINSQQTTKKDSLPTDPETDQEEMLPETETVTEQAVIPMEETPKQKDLGINISRSKDTDEKLLRLLSTGTHVQIPDSIPLNLDAVPREPSPALPQEHYAVSFTKASLSEINATLNQWMDTLQ